MKRHFAIGVSLVTCVFQMFAAESNPAVSRVQRIVDASVAHVLTRFEGEKLKREEIAVTLVDLNDAAHPAAASFRGDARIYPASVIKLFYLEAAHRWMEDGKIDDTPELRRAMRDMIVESSNDATHYVMDVVTGTTSGPELPEAEMRQWEEKRDTINRYFKTRGFANINANQKPWCEGPYGRDRIFVGEAFTNRNALTTDATARLLTEVVQGRCVSAKRSAEMLELLRRDPFAKSTDADDQSHGFSGSAIPSGGKLWSKAGWTSQTRHDAAYIELPTGAKFVLVTFTVRHAQQREIIPAVAREVIRAMER